AIKRAGRVSPKSCLVRASMKDSPKVCSGVPTSLNPCPLTRVTEHKSTIVRLYRRAVSISYSYRYRRLSSIVKNFQLIMALVIARRAKGIGVQALAWLKQIGFSWIYNADSR